MKVIQSTRILAVSSLLCLASLCLSACQTSPSLMSNVTKTINPAKGFQLESTDIQQNTMLNINQVFNGFGCTGNNISPQLSWKNVPQGTKSIAITVYDPDAPTGSGWWHWLAVNIPNNVTGISADERFSDMPNVVQTRTDYGSTGFGGACPPKGDQAHRYEVTVWALDVEKLPNVTKNSSGALVGYFLNNHKIATSTITALYQR